MVGGSELKKYLRMIKFVYDNRKLGDGYVPNLPISENIGVSVSNVWKVLTPLSNRGLVKKSKEGRNCIWRITPRGIKYLRLKGIIEQDEMEQAVKELERTSWVVD